jgi:cobalt-zinc-cadmium efflux system outer membrane protein
MVMATYGRSRRHARRFSTLTLTLAIVVGLAPHTLVAAAEPAPRPSGAVALDDALAAALAHNPELQAHALELRAQDAHVQQEGLLPNPSLSTEVENFGRFGGDDAGTEDTQTTVSLTQLVELGGKRARRTSLARLDGRLAGRDYERARLDVAATTRKRFVAGLLAQERAGLAERLRRLAVEAVHAVRRQVDAGAASSVELVRAEAAVAQAEAVAARRGREVRAALVTLAATWGDPAPQLTRLLGALGPLAPPRPVDEYRGRLRGNPDLARWDAARERADAAVALEEARRVPDVTVRVGSRRFVVAEANAFVAEVAIPLPLFNRNQGALQEAQVRAAKTAAERRAAAVGADAALSMAYEELVAAFEHTERLEHGVLPRARAALDGTRRGHAQGMLRYLDVVEAQRSIADVEGDYLESLARYHTAAAELERLTGPASGGDGGGK